MKRLVLAGGVLGLLAGAVVLGDNSKPAKGGSDEAARTAAIRLFQSLDENQKKLALKEFDDKERRVEQFPPVERPGLPFDKLTMEQQALAAEAIRAMTSEYGAERCLAVLKQTGGNRQYLNFFGEPSPGKPFAWRVATHHLTMLYAEFGEAKSEEFGPVLLGGNPVNQLWDDEEKLAMEFFQSLTEEQKKKVAGHGGSGAPIGKDGLKIADLEGKPKDLAKALLQKRLDVFSADRRRILESLIERDGGMEQLKIAVWGDLSKSNRDGGTPNWKIGNDRLLFDWQTAGRNHIHMTVRAKAKA
ncbi:MAG TPA: DUF3500 domain-containing protein [Gemmataceae bacterium]|jgi:hypothetical protein|nr:DUF3500 domain-containing protein [Gemmataceae bacterium]